MKKFFRKLNVWLCREWCKQQFPCKKCVEECKNCTHDGCCNIKQIEYIEWGQGNVQSGN